MKIALLYGGKTGEHEVSVVSATSVARAINTKKHQVSLISISKKGEWFLQDSSELERINGDSSALLSDAATKKRISVVPGGGTAGAFLVNEAGCANVPLAVDIVLPILHGTFGEDGLVQGLLEMAELPYCGCGVCASAVSMDKEKTKQVWIQAGLPVVPYIALRRIERTDSAAFEEIIGRAEKEFGYPVFVKPCRAGSSVGASKAADKNALMASIDEALLWDDKILIEPFVSAREIECSVTGVGEITAYTPCEICPTHEFYDYEAKYLDPEGANFKVPAAVDAETLNYVKETAVKAFKALDGDGFSRIDFFMDKKSGKLMLNEINTIPGFTSISMFPKMCSESGLAYSDLIELLLSLGVRRFEESRRLKTSRV